MPEPDPAMDTEDRRELAGLCTVVTGASSGIGRAIALEFAAAGADVVVCARRSRDALEETATACRERGVTSFGILEDLSEENGCRALADAVWQRLSRVDVWVNNAGADVLTAERSSLTYEEKLDLLWRIDVRGTILLCRDAGARMAAGGGGSILNLGWDQAAIGMEGESGELFGATKGAVMAFSRSLALSLAPVVRVNCLAPGWIRTAWGESASTEWQERVLREVPLSRWGQPEDVARAARFLASPQAAFITGQVINVGGGAVR